MATPPATSVAFRLPESLRLYVYAGEVAMETGLQQVT